MKKIVSRIVLYILGLYILSWGVAFSINSNLGGSPMNSFPIAISAVTGLNKGLCVTGIFTVYVLIQILILRKDFELKNLFQIVFATIFGYMVNFSSFLLGDFAFPTYFGKLGMLAISIVFIAVGITLYIIADLVPMPSEGLAMTIAEKIGQPFHRIKIAVDCTSVVFAIAVSLIGLGRLSGVREGTIITALTVGKGIDIATRFLKPKLDPFLVENPQQQITE